MHDSYCFCYCVCSRHDSVRCVVSLFLSLRCQYLLLHALRLSATHCLPRNAATVYIRLSMCSIELRMNFSLVERCGLFLFSATFFFFSCAIEKFSSIQFGLSFRNFRHRLEFISRNHAVTLSTFAMRKSRNFIVNSDFVAISTRRPVNRSLESHLSCAVAISHVVHRATPRKRRAESETKT